MITLISIHDFTLCYFQEKVLKYEEYCKHSEELVVWVKRVMMQLESRTFPTTIQGMKVHCNLNSILYLWVFCSSLYFLSEFCLFVPLLRVISLACAQNFFDVFRMSSRILTSSILRNSAGLKKNEFLSRPSYRTLT